jgi:hypothetical protein
MSAALAVALVCATDVGCAANALKLAKRDASEEHRSIAAVDGQQVARAGSDISCEASSYRLKSAGRRVDRYAFKGISALDKLRIVNESDCVFVNPGVQLFGFPIITPIWYKRQSNRVDWCWTPYADNQRWMSVQRDSVDTGFYRGDKPMLMNLRVIWYLRNMGYALATNSLGAGIDQVCQSELLLEGPEGQRYLTASAGSEASAGIGRSSV